MASHYFPRLWSLRGQPDCFVGMPSLAATKRLRKIKSAYRGDLGRVLCRLLRSSPWRTIELDQGAPRPTEISSTNIGQNGGVP